MKYAAIVVICSITFISGLMIPQSLNSEMLFDNMTSQLTLAYCPKWLRMLRIC